MTSTHSSDFETRRRPPRSRRGGRQKADAVSVVESIPPNAAARDIEQPDGDDKYYSVHSCHPYSQWRQVKTDVLAGIAVAFAKVPEAVAFALLANLDDPAIGLQSAWILGILTALFGSRTIMISCASGATAAVLAPYMLDLGVNYLFYIVILSGIFELVFGFLRLMKFVRLVPVTVVIGFLNGLAVVIALSQLHAFHVSQFAHPGVPAGTWIWQHDAVGAGGATFGLMLAHVAVSMSIVHFLPKLTRVVPSSLVAIIVGIASEQVLRAASSHTLVTPLIGEVTPFSGGMPPPIFADARYALPSLAAWDTWRKIAWPAFSCAAVAIIECSLTMEVLNDRLESPNPRPNQQFVAMGGATAVSGVLGGMGGSPLIGLSLINAHSGASPHFRISGVVAGLCVLFVVLFAGDAVAVVPSATLAGIMILVVIHTFNWASLRLLFEALMPQRWREARGWRRKIQRSEVLVIVVVSVLVPTTDVLIGFIVGMFIAALAYAWRSGDMLVVKSALFAADNRLIDDGSGAGGSSHVSCGHTHLRHHHHHPHHSSSHHSHHIHHSHHGSHHSHRSHHRPSASALGGGSLRISPGRPTTTTTAAASATTPAAAASEVGSRRRDSGGDGAESHLSRSGGSMHHRHHRHHHGHHGHSAIMGSSASAPTRQEPVAQAATTPPPSSPRRMVSGKERSPKAVHFLSPTVNRLLQHEMLATPQTTLDLDLNELHNAAAAAANVPDTIEEADRDDDIDSIGTGSLGIRRGSDDAELQPLTAADAVRKVYLVEGPLFFGTVSKFVNSFTPKSDPDDVEVHWSLGQLVDFSAIEALNNVGGKYEALGKRFHLKYLNATSEKLVQRADHLRKNFQYTLAEAELPPMESAVGTMSVYGKDSHYAV